MKGEVDVEHARYVEAIWTSRRKVRGSLIGIVLIFMSFGIVGATAFVYENAQQTARQNIQNIANIALKDFALGTIEEGQTLHYTKSNLTSLGAAMTLATTKANVYMHLGSDLPSQSGSYTRYDIVVKYITVPVGSMYGVGDTVATLTLIQPNSGAVRLDVGGAWAFDLEIITTAKSVSADTPTTVTITVTAESS
jgi:hypothetical protein